MNSKKVLMLVASEGFQPVEYAEPRRILEEAGVEVKIASDQKGQAVSFQGVEKATVDFLVEEARIDDFDAIVLVGGPGALEHLDNEATYKLVQEAQQKQKLVAAICISPRILAHAGILDGRKATGWNGDSALPEVLASSGATYIAEPVVVDNNIITAWGPSDATEFGKQIVTLLGV